MRPGVARAARSLTGIVIAVLALAACASSQSQPTPRPTISASAPASPIAGLKPALGGLLDRDGPPPSSFVPAMGGFVVNVHWSDLQASPGADIPAGNAIDQAITALHQLDPSGKMGLKIRLFAGIYSPDWAKSLGGAPIPISDPQSGASGTVGRFWSSDFGAAYTDLMSKLAARYDSAPEVREVTISQCTTVFAEPFIRDAASASAVSALLAAGFTVAADQQCHRDQILAHRVWTHTRSDLSLNPYQVIDGSARTDEAFTDSMMDFCRSTLGSACVLANNSLRVPLQYPLMYARIKALGAPIAFQTATLAKIGDLSATLETAISLGAGSVELPSGFDTMSLPALAAFNSRLQALAPS